MARIPLHLVEKTMTFNPTSHLNEADIAAYLDGAMEDAERRIVEAHLSGCDECRIEVITSQEAVSTAPRAGTRRKIPMRSRRSQAAS